MWGCFLTFWGCGRRGRHTAASWQHGTACSGWRLGWQTANSVTCNLSSCLPSCAWLSCMVLYMPCMCQRVRPQDAALPLLERLMPGVGRLLEKGRFPEERRIAICVMDDILEHTPAGAAKYMAQVGGPDALMTCVRLERGLEPLAIPQPSSIMLSVCLLSLAVPCLL